MRLDGVRWAGGELIFSTSDPEAIRLMRDFEPGDYELKPKKRLRSLDANAYAWMLMDRLSAATGLSKSEIYRNTIRDIGGVSEVVCVQKRPWTSSAPHGSETGLDGRRRGCRARLLDV